CRNSWTSTTIWSESPRRPSRRPTTRTLPFKTTRAWTSNRLGPIPNQVLSTACQKPPLLTLCGVSMSARATPQTKCILFRSRS
ncbi:hypothetical protein, partial [Arthrobacter sp. DR-2P]